MALFVLSQAHIMNISTIKRVRNGLEVPAETVDLTTGVHLDAPAGSVMYFHAKLVHTSEPNATSHPRRVMIYSHYPKRANMGIDVRKWS